MASIKLGAIASDIRGSIGGTVFSRNGGGAYAKCRTCPTNPNTAAQQIVRSIMSAMYAAWAALTAGVKDGWNTYAKSVTLVNRLGDAINVSAYNMYARTKAVCELLGVAMPATAPATMSLAEQDSTLAVALDASDSDMDVTFDDSLGWANEVGGYMAVYQGRPVNPTVNSYDGPWKYAGKISGAAEAPSSPATIASQFTLNAGQKCFIKCRVLRADGRLSTPFRCSGSVSA